MVFPKLGRLIFLVVSGLLWHQEANSFEHLERKAQSLLLPSWVSFLLFYTLARETPRLSWRAAGFASRSAHTPTIGGSWRFWIIRVKSSSAVRRG